jgi:hypothetical protein
MIPTINIFSKKIFDINIALFFILEQKTLPIENFKLAYQPIINRLVI